MFFWVLLSCILIEFSAFYIIPYSTALMKLLLNFPCGWVCLFEIALLHRKIRNSLSPSLIALSKRKNNVKLQQEWTLTSAYFSVSAEPESFPTRTVITARCVNTCMLAMMKALWQHTLIHIWKQLRTLWLLSRSTYWTSKGGKFLRKLWCCVGGSITR